MADRLPKVIADVAERFVYRADGAKDVWRPSVIGDCEDFSLQVVREYAGSLLAFWWCILFGRFRFWGTTIHGDGHFVVEDTRSGLYFDNRAKALSPRAWMEEEGNVFKGRFSRWYVFKRVVSPWV